MLSGLRAAVPVCSPGPLLTRLITTQLRATAATPSMKAKIAMIRALRRMAFSCESSSSSSPLLEAVCTLPVG
jgi:hypothetical protein